MKHVRDVTTYTSSLLLQVEVQRGERKLLDVTEISRVCEESKLQCESDDVGILQ
jgi:hypothetical protein